MALGDALNIALDTARTFGDRAYVGRLPYSVAMDRVRALRERPGAPKRRALVVLGLVIVGYLLGQYLIGRELGETSTTLGRFASPTAAMLVMLAVALLGLLVAARAKGRLSVAWLGLAVMCFSSAWWMVRVHWHDPSEMAAAIEREAKGADGGELLSRLRGVVRDGAQPIARPRGALGDLAVFEPGIQASLVLSGDGGGELGGELKGVVRVRVRGEREQLQDLLKPGQVVEVLGVLRGVPAQLNPGEPDWRALAHASSVAGDIDVPKPELLTIVPARNWRERVYSGLWRVLGSMRERCVRVISGDGSDAAAEHAAARALLGALLLGERSEPARPVSEAFTRLGLTHLVAISGFNLAVMAGMAMLLLRLTGDRGWLEPLGMAILVGGYLLVLPAQASIVRAGALVLVLLLAEALGRRHDRATLTAWIGVGVLIVRPTDLLDLGFQLSFGIVLALMLFGQAMHLRLWGAPLRGLAPTYTPDGQTRVQRAAWHGLACLRVIKRAFQASVTASLLAWGVSLPWLAFATGQVNLLAPVLTLVVLPLTVVVLWIGYIVLLVGVLVPSLTAMAGEVIYWPARLLVDVVLLLDETTMGLVRVPPVSVWWALAGAAGVLWLLVHGRLRDRWSWAVGTALSVWLAVVIVLRPGLPPDVLLRLDALSLGHGACTLVRSDGQAILIDAGSMRTSVGLNTIPRALRELGVRRVDTLILTSASMPRLSGVIDLMEQVPIGRVLVSEQVQNRSEREPQSPAGRTLRALAKRNVQILTFAQDSKIAWSATAADKPAHLNIDVLWPPPEQPTRPDADAASVLRIRMGEDRQSVSVLLTGEASPRVLEQLAARADGLARGQVIMDASRRWTEAPAFAAWAHAHGRVVLFSGASAWAEESAASWRVVHDVRRGGSAWVEILRDGTIRTGRHMEVPAR